MIDIDLRELFTEGTYSIATTMSDTHDQVIVGYAQEGSSHLSWPFPIGKSRIANPILHSDSSYALGVVISGLVLGRIISIASTTTVRRKKLRSVPPGGQLSFSNRLEDRPTGQTLSSGTSPGVTLLFPLVAKDQTLL